jgi:hypothetical protein
MPTITNANKKEEEEESSPTGTTWLAVSSPAEARKKS